MSELGPTLETALESLLRRIVRQEIQTALAGRVVKTVDAPGKPYLTVRQAAEASGLGASTIRLYIRKRQLGAQHVGRRVLINRADLEKFLEASPIHAIHTIEE
jgi:excisionase family DNA binding protein